MRAHLDCWERRLSWAKLLWSRTGGRWMRWLRAWAVTFPTLPYVTPARSVTDDTKSTTHKRRQCDETGMGRDESGAPGTNRARVGTNQRRGKTGTGADEGDSATVCGRKTPGSAPWSRGSINPGAENRSRPGFRRSPGRGLLSEAVNRRTRQPAGHHRFPGARHRMRETPSRRPELRRPLAWRVHR